MVVILVQTGLQGRGRYEASVSVYSIELLPTFKAACPLAGIRKDRFEKGKRVLSINTK